MIKKFFTREDRPFFIGILIMNIVILTLAHVCIINPPEILKKSKYKNIERKHENSR